MPRQPIPASCPLGGSQDEDRIAGVPQHIVESGDPSGYESDLCAGGVQDPRWLWGAPQSQHPIWG